MGYFLWSKTLTICIRSLNIHMETNITITDLVAIRNIMNIAAERGAFKAEEMADVGTVYNKLNKFLEAVIAQAQASEQPPEQTETPEGE